MRWTLFVGLLVCVMLVAACTQQASTQPATGGMDGGDSGAVEGDGAMPGDVEPASGPGCTDTDSGKNYNLKGTVTPAGGSPQEDRCIGTQYSYPNRLKEFYCAPDGKHANELYDCPDGCQDGACV